MPEFTSAQSSPFTAAASSEIMRAVLIGRFTFYDPRLPLVIR